MERDRTKPDRWKGKQPGVEGPKRVASHGRVRPTSPHALPFDAGATHRPAGALAFRIACGVHGASARTS